MYEIDRIKIKMKLVENLESTLWHLPHELVHTITVFLSAQAMRQALVYTTLRREQAKSPDIRVSNRKGLTYRFNAEVETQLRGQLLT